MSLSLIWRLNTGTVLASDSQATVNNGKKIISAKCQKTFAMNCQFPLGAVYCGSSIVGETAISQILNQNYEQERETLAGYADLIHEELREALKYRHPKIETTNFAIHLAGFCYSAKTFQHFVISTKRLELNAPRLISAPLFLGGDVDKNAVQVLQKHGISPKRNNISTIEAAQITGRALDELYETKDASLDGPSQILIVKEDRISWSQGPSQESILELI